MNTSRMIENMDGRVFVHSIGNGAVLLVVERENVNVSLILDPKNALDLGRLLFIDLGGERRAATGAAYSDPEPPESREPLALPAANGSTGEQPSAPRGSARHTPEYYRRVAELFRMDRDQYYSRRLDRTGRTAFVADKLSISYTAAKYALTQARRSGYLRPSDRAVKGKPPLSVNGQS